MKYILAIRLMAAFLFLTLVALPGCSRIGSSINGSGALVDQDIRLTGFTGINITGPFQADIIQTDAFQVIVNTDENLVNRIESSLNDQILVIGIKAPGSFFPTSLKLKIGMPRIYTLQLAGGAKASLSGFKSTFNLSVVLAEASILNGTLDAGNCDFDLSESSQINLTGSALGLDLTASDASKINLENFNVNIAKLYLKQNSEATLNLNGRTDVRLENASTVYYVGNPVFNDTSISGGSFMKHK